MNRMSTAGLNILRDTHAELPLFWRVGSFTLSQVTCSDYCSTQEFHESILECISSCTFSSYSVGKS